jgi:hypothetical protein
MITHEERGWVFGCGFRFQEAISKRKCLVVCVVVHLPFRLKLDGKGDPDQSTGDDTASGLYPHQ